MIYRLHVDCIIIIFQIDCACRSVHMLCILYHNVCKYYFCQSIRQGKLEIRYQ